ncbi:MAG TPA: orotidine-5'-phosphate decarboxylase [Euryarchaeota archaeon]|nr:orotidine-5'-phosphate decarboxylase [Euryarchaeota archaeon]
MSKSRLVLALDVTDQDKAMEITKCTAPYVAAIKVNYPLILSCELKIVTDISRFAPVICDFKIADIPNTNRLIVEQAVKAGAEGIICHAFVGRDSVKQCVDSAGDSDVFVVTEMSHPGGLEFTGKHWNELATIARECGARGVIAPATRPERVREVRKIIGNDMLILSPGVGVQGGKASDVLEAGADIIIVGRSIYGAEDPGGVAREFFKACQ